MRQDVQETTTINRGNGKTHEIHLVNIHRNSDSHLELRTRLCSTGRAQS